jgi:RNA polymerase sigma-70 factor (ECF subfamily)
MPNRSSQSSTDLILRIKSGNPEALGEAYSRYADALMALAYRLTGSAQDAEDILHDVFLGLPEALRNYEERGSVEHWLKRVTARVAFSKLRAAKTRRETANDFSTVAASNTANAIDDDWLVKQAIASLSPALRAVFVLKEVEGYSHAEIASLLGITPGNSEVRLHRAVKELRQRLSPTRPRE